MTAARTKVHELVPGAIPPRDTLGVVLLDRPATRADLDHLPRTWRGEIIHGVMHAFPRPKAPHQRAGYRIGHSLDDPYDLGRGGPGGWIFLTEPGIQLPGAAEVSPDVAGWKRERLPGLPRRGPIRVAPDWVCQVLSPRTRSYDHVVKRRFYAEAGVGWLWYVDPIARLLVASRLESGRWLEIGAWRDSEKARVEPFEATELDLALWWEGIAPEADPEESESPEPPSATG